MPSYEDNVYKIRDNQFWYSKCSFAKDVDNIKYITIKITGPCNKIFELEHSEQGGNPEPTKSFKFTNPVDRQWWKEHRQEIVRVELLAIDNEIIGSEPQISEDTKQNEGIEEVTSVSQGEKTKNTGKGNFEDSVLCIGLDIAWFGGSANNVDSQYDCLGWISLPPHSKKSSRAEFGIKRFKLHQRDSNATILLKEIEDLLSKHREIKRVVFAIDAPIQAYERKKFPIRKPMPGRGEVERRACENFLNIKRKFIDQKAGGANGWQPNIQPGAPIAPRVQCLLNGLAKLDFQLWKKETKCSEKLVIECFPAEAIWAIKRLGYYPENLTAKAVKEYKKQNRQLLTAQQIRTLVYNILNAFDKLTGFSELWKEFIESYLLEWMLQDTTWQNPDNHYRGGKLLDDVVDTAICLATSLSYAHGDYHVWQDKSCPEDGHIIGPGAKKSLLRD